MKAFDLLVDASENLVVRDGDFAVGPSDAQHVRHLLRANYGHYRFAPLVGVGIERRLSGPFTAPGLEAAVRRQLDADGYLVVLVQVSRTAGININAERIR